MNVELKILRSLYEQVHEDLDRPHEFAFERVGFLFSRRSAREGRTVLAFEYRSIRDDGYVETDDVGARFRGAVIREQMQTVLDKDVGIFHVHRHNHEGHPRFSHIDLVSLCEFLPAFHSVGPHEVHGALLLSNSGASAVIWDADTKTLKPVSRVSIVGFPMKSFVELKSGMKGIKL